MSSLAEAVRERLTYKLYASALIDPTVEPVASVAPAATGGQVLRHVSHNLSLNKDSYRPNEKRQDRQQVMGKHGSRTVPGTINGFLSPGTHADLFAAVLRSTWTPAVAGLDESDFTSAAFDATASTVTFASGDPVALGLEVGKVITFGLLATAGNNDVHFVILGFSGGSNRVVEIFPAPITQAADTAFTVETVGEDIIAPASAQTDYKFAFEVYNPDIDLARFYSEARIGGFDLTVGVNANVGLNFSLLGRNRTILESGSAPFFTSPTAETTTDIPTSMQGLLRLNGETLGVCTGVNIKAELGPEAAKVINPDGLVAGILLGELVVSGDFSVFLTDGVVLAAFDNETEMELICYLPSSNAAEAPANVFYLPRIKINSNNESEASKAKAIQCQFEAARYVGAAPGVPSTTIRIVDTTLT